jgi:sugar O-acyltransferase (sialic acid O-acetyltransferase NeuD family)
MEKSHDLHGPRDFGSDAVCTDDACERHIVVLGLESRFGHDVVDTLASAGIKHVACVRSRHDADDAGPYANMFLSVPESHQGAEFVVPLLTPGRRKLRVEEARSLGLVDAYPVLHPTSVCSPTTKLGRGSILGAMAVISSHTRTGEHLLMNRSASLGHDCTIGDYCTLGPSSAICGACVLEDGVFVGAGAVICPHVHIGRNAVIAAGSIVSKDVPAHTLVAGNPARVAKADILGYRDIGV